MKNFIPYDKMSKKEKQKLNLSKRNGWGEINPITRVADTDKKRYRRKGKYPPDYQ